MSEEVINADPPDGRPVDAVAATGANAHGHRNLGIALALTQDLFERAAARGELAEGADPELLAQVLPAVAIHRTFIFGVRPEREYVERVVDEIVLPACRAETVR